MIDDEKRYMLISVAKRYAGRRYEIDELVNEAWLSRHVRDAIEPPLVWLAARWAMLNYMRKQQHVGQRQNHLKFHSLYVQETGYLIEPVVMPLGIAQVRDDLEYMARELTPKQKKIMKWKFEGRKMKWIGEQFGVSGERGRQLWGQIQAIMSIRYKVSMCEAVA